MRLVRTKYYLISDYLENNLIVYISFKKYGYSSYVYDEGRMFFFNFNALEDIFKKYHRSRATYWFTTT